jgi:hypothetical protein
MKVPKLVELYRFPLVDFLSGFGTVFKVFAGFYPFSKDR